MTKLNRGPELFSLIGRSLAVLAVIAGILFLPALPAFAAQGEPPAGPAPASEPGGGLRLELALKRAQVALANLQNWLEFGRDVAETTQTRIDAQKEQGRDTSSLETALADFRARLDLAEAALADAETTLARKAGFDETGKVTDRELARQTLQSAAESLREAHRTMRAAMVDLRRAVAAYRHANQAQ